MTDVSASQMTSTEAPTLARPELRVPWADVVAAPVGEPPTARIAVFVGPSAPRSGGDVEKALLITCKNDSGRQRSYIREHLKPKSVRKFWRNCPIGADLLALLVRLLADTASTEDRELVSAIGAAPSTATLVAMFDAGEMAALKKLQDRVGVEAFVAWSTGAADGGA